MDALVASYIAECNAEIENKAKNTENNVSKCSKLFQYVPICSNMQQDKKEMFQIVPKCSWNFSGEEIRIILRRSLVKPAELAKVCEISRTQLSRYLKMEVFPMEIAKKLAAMIGLSTSEEIQEYYDKIKEV